MVMESVVNEPVSVTVNAPIISAVLAAALPPKPSVKAPAGPTTVPAPTRTLIGVPVKPVGAIFNVVTVELIFAGVMLPPAAKPVRLTPPTVMVSKPVTV